MIARLRREFLDVREGEWPTAVALSLFFFLVIAVFWVFKPIKRGLMLAYYDGRAFELLGWRIESFGGAEAEQIAKAINMVVVYGVVVLFTVLVRKLQRQQVVYVFCAILAALTLLFSFAVASPGGLTVWSFFVYGDVFNSIMVATFWAFTNDVVRPEQSKRLYGLIGLGGVVGGLVGATFVSAWVGALGRQPILWTAAVSIVAIAGITRFVDRHDRASGHGPVASRQRADPGRSGGDAATDDGDDGATPSAALEGARLVFQSPYLLAILGIIGLYEIVSNIVDYQLAKSIEMAVAGGLDYDAAFGFVGVLTNGLSVGVQLFATSLVMKRYGVGTALLFLPAAMLVGSVGYLVLPVVGVAVFMSVSDNSLNYSINQSAKESLYTPTTRAEKYQAKAFIDMFVQRFAKVLAVGLNLGFAAFVSAAGARWLSVVSLLVLFAWIATVRYAGRRFEERATDAEGTSGAPSPDGAAAASAAG